MSWADYAIVAGCFASAAFGAWRGFAKEALSIVTWLAAILLAWKFAWVAEPAVGRWIAAPEVKLWAARALILIVVLIAGGLVAWLARQALRVTGLRGMDRTLGSLFGLARGALLVGLAAIALELGGLDQETWWQQARLRPVAERIAAAIRDYGSLGAEYLREQQIVGAVQGFTEGTAVCAES